MSFLIGWGREKVGGGNRGTHRIIKGKMGRRCLSEPRKKCKKKEPVRGIRGGAVVTKKKGKQGCVTVYKKRENCNPGGLCTYGFKLSLCQRGEENRGCKREKRRKGSGL